MALDVNRWLKYAKARLDAAVGSGNKRLDELEARREVERGERPWTDEHDGIAPTMDQVRARIEREEARQRAGADTGGGVPDRPEPTATDEPGPTTAPAPEAVEAPADTAPGDTAPGDTAPGDDAPAPNGPASDASEPAAGPAPADPAPAAPAGPAPRSPQEQAEDAEREMARLELEARQRASAQRLDDIRRELGVDTPDTPTDKA